MSWSEPYVFYTHPWEIDPDQPRIRGLGRSQAFRHYVNLTKTEARLDALLRDFPWTGVADFLDGRKNELSGASR